jgi:hypothetical protein
MKSQGEIVGTTSHLVTAPEQLKQHQKLKFHLLEIENTKNMGQLKACVAVVNEDILIEPEKTKPLSKSKTI